MDNVLSQVLALELVAKKEPSSYVAELIPVDEQKLNQEMATALAAKVLLKRAFLVELQGRHISPVVPGAFLESTLQLLRELPLLVQLKDHSRL